MTKKRRESNFGPPSNPRKGGNFYGKLKRGIDAKRFRRNQAHEVALIEDLIRDALKRVGV